MSTNNTNSSASVRAASMDLGRRSLSATWILVGAVFLFGCLIAIGAVWFNHDIRKGAIVLTCSLVFTGGFWVVSRWGNQSQPRCRSDAMSPVNKWYFWSFASLFLAVMAWATAIASSLWPPATARVGLAVLLSMAVAILASFVMGIVIISRPQRAPGAGVALLSISAVVALVIYSLIRLIFGA
jgi:hypothetical protein